MLIVIMQRNSNDLNFNNNDIYNFFMISLKQIL